MSIPWLKDEKAYAIGLRVWFDSREIDGSIRVSLPHFLALIAIAEAAQHPAWLTQMDQDIAHKALSDALKAAERVP